MRSMVIVGSLLLALSSSTMAAQVYKWVDAQGITHFSAQPPQGQAAQTLNTVTPPPKSVAAESDASENSESLVDQEKIDRKVKQQVAEQEAERKRYCETLQTNLAQLQNNPRVRVEENGEVRRLKEEERQSRIAETKQKIEENCKQ
ncbi:MAG: DUF4124 domain-containing protein [Pseudomonas sp.]|uniref:DUF4124 domain-containing protein n=1 Tax=Stutzerimonas degradans TaxID=2968968 RepID=UPI0012D8AAFD|nr:DUF4124 domain-containing protein [Stutzerimonas degradans]MCF6751048.1 DUF4124 domain-containing protein [Stutzerimonas stutzeri]MEB2327672.1 DUF4124 domain-containing protein [Pseudomonas sp.]MTZ15548.1 DUF4124 domain-containing protein [Stutzerimonas degradans]NHW01169.1 DUF4124 domain-containing protein [Stutzerimonas degradans]